MLVDRRMLEPIRQMRSEGKATAILSAAYDYGIMRSLEEAGHAETFETIVANKLLVEDGMAVRFTTDFIEHKADGFKDEFLERRGYRPDTVVYSGDTGWFDGLTRASAGADLFICECTLRHTQLDFHLSLDQLREHRSELDCGRLMLTHLGHEMAELRGELEIETADDGLLIKL